MKENTMRAFIMGIVLALFSTAALADNVLILGGEGDSYVSVQTELEAAKHTVTYDSGTVLPDDISSYQQIWDMRYNTAVSESDMAAYDTFLKNNGYLYFTGEHSGFATRNNSISDFTNTLGGGTITVSGFAIDDQDAVDGFFSADTTVKYSASAIITIDEGGTARVLSTDANGDPTGIMYIGNAGDLGEAYNGTVVVIADVNWTQSFAMGESSPNRIFLQELINGIVAGTVGGTIDENGNGDAGSVGGEPAGPTVTTGSGTRTYTVATADIYSVTDDSVIQTVEHFSNSDTCTQGTVTTLHDGVVQDDLTVDSSDDPTCVANDAVLQDTITGRVDQLATAADVTDVNLRNLSFDGIQGIRSNHDYANGMTGETTGFTLGGEVIADNGLIVGGGWARINTNLSGNGDTATATTNAFEGNVGRAMGSGVGTVTLRHATTDYGFGRTIGDWSNTGATSGSNSSVSGRFILAQDPNFNPYIGYTIGRKSMDAYTEAGDALTARSVAGTNEMYRYATIGANIQLGLINLHGEHNTDGVQAIGIGIGKTTERLDWDLGVEKTTTDLGENTGITAGIKIKF